MTKQTKNAIVTVADNDNSTALLTLLRSTVPLEKLAVPALTAPKMPDKYPEVKAGVHRMGEQLADPSRSDARRTSVDDVSRELEELLVIAASKGLPFDKLPDALEYDRAMKHYRSQQDDYLRRSNKKAAALCASVQEWVNDIAAVLQIKTHVGLEVLQEAAAAQNKTFAALALDLHIREHLTSAGSAGLPVMAAGRGLMQVQAAGVDVASLVVADLEMLVALAGLSIMPDALPGYGLSPDPLEFRLLGSAVKVTQQAAILHQTADTAQGSNMLPRKVLAAVSSAALAEVQARIDARLLTEPHRFGEQSLAFSSLQASRRRTHGCPQGEYAAKLD
ncbi:hypothetical protein [Stutzerimonas nitrititolerans]|uniref:hypothetical protein n=1 Tax=Stutzerimonas nitrititolerans TaxID=2482751 RepID=UPI0028A7849F|nr:hypothetical protein [Stutzerimonas nitrititolerans]